MIFGCGSQCFEGFEIVCEVNFAPQQPLVVDTFKNCEGLSRIAFLDGNGVVMLGKIVKKVDKVESAKKK